MNKKELVKAVAAKSGQSEKCVIETLDAILNSLRDISKVVGFIIRSFIALIFGSIALIAAVMAFPIYLCTSSRTRYTEILE